MITLKTLLTLKDFDDDPFYIDEIITGWRFRIKSPLLRI